MPTNDRRIRRVRLNRAVPAALLALTGLTAGCRDEAADARAVAQEKITAASHDLALATLTPVEPADPTFDDTRSTLQRITRDVAGLRDIEPGQQAAASLVAASAHRSLADMTLARASIVEAERRRTRRQLHSEIDAARRLDSLVSGHEAVTTDSQRQTLSAERTEANRELRDFSERLAALDQPIREREASNVADAAEMERLESQASRLRRTAAERGPADGLDSFMEAVDLEREADRFAIQIAMRETDLRYDLRPEHELADTRAGNLKQILNDISDSESALDDFESAGRRRVASTREKMGEFRSRIDDGLARISESAASELDPLYEEAGNHLDEALRAARSAASKSGRGRDASARLTVVQVLASQASLRLREAREYGARAALLGRLAEAGPGLGDPDGYRAAAGEFRTAHDEAVQAARERIQEAQQELGSVSGRGTEAQTEALRRTLERMTASIDGGSMPAAAAAAGAGADTGAAGGPSPEAFLARLQAGARDGSDLGNWDLFHASQPRAREVIAVLREVTATEQALQAAVRAQFGDAAAEEMAASMAGGGAGGPGAGAGGGLEAMMAANMAALQDARITDHRGNEAYITSGAGTQPEDRMRIVLVDGAWKMDGDAMFAAIDPVQAQQMSQMMKGIQSAMAALTDRVRAGDFGSPQEVQQALMTELLGSMGGMGAGGMPPG